MKDPTLRELLPTAPKFIYRKKFVKNILDPPRKTIMFLDKTGFYKCRRCLVCRTSKDPIRKRLDFLSGSTELKYNIKTSITCPSVRVTYVLACPCGLQYAGRTTQALSTRVQEHMNNIGKGHPKRGGVLISKERAHKMKRNRFLNWTPSSSKS